MIRRPYLLFLLATAWWPAETFAKVDLKVRASQTTRYFLVDKRIRHQVTELGLRQVADVREGVSTVVDGRLRYDSALFPTPVIKMRDYPKSVRDDEGFEADSRQVYVDILSGNWAYKIGRIQFDWTESLSPRTSDAVTALDLRHGGMDSAGEIIEPVEALSANTSVGFGSVEFMVVPRGRHHRLPKDRNGYGYIERLDAMLGGVQKVLVASGFRGDIETDVLHGSIPRDVDHAEFGARFLTSASGVDFSIFGWRGHQRTPSILLELNQKSDSTVLNPQWDLTASENFQQMNSYGAFASYGGEAAVYRLFGLYEPGRRPGMMVEGDLAAVIAQASPDTSLILGDRAFRDGAVEDRVRGGGGFDYVFSKHLKLYSEGYVTLSKVTGVNIVGEGTGETFRDHTVTLRLTNESFSNVLISCDSTLTGPERSWMISPDITFDLRDGASGDSGIERAWKISFGGWFIQSESEKSALKILRDARQVYARVAMWM